MKFALFILIFLFIKLTLILAFTLGIFSTFEFVSIYNPLSSFCLGYLWHKIDNRPLKIVSVVVLDTCLPVYGFLSLVFFMFTGPIFRFFYDKDGDDEKLPLGEEIYTQYSDDKKALLEKRILKTVDQKLYESFKIEPYLDILSGHSIELKVNAIEKLSQNPSAQSVKILKRALDDPEYEVRYFSNNALAKIEKDIISKIDILSESIIKDPTNYQNYNQRGGLYLDSFNLGFLDESLSRYFLEKALYDFIYSMQLFPNQSQLYVNITQVYLHLEDYQNVLFIADQALKTEISRKERGKVLFYRAEAHFNLGMFDLVREDCGSVLEHNLNYPVISESCKWWTDVKS